MMEPMAEARRHLAQLGLPDRDLGELPTSAKRFRDGAQYRVEIPSVEGPDPFRAVLDAAKERELRVHRISQGSGMMLLTDDEIEAMVALGVEHGVEVCLEARALLAVVGRRAAVVVALHHDVEIAGRRTQHQIAHRAAKGRAGGRPPHFDAELYRDRLLSHLPDRVDYVCNQIGPAVADEGDGADPAHRLRHRRARAVLPLPRWCRDGS
jgi:hypothetical protein